MKNVVDTNIIFSALLNSNNTIGNIIFNSQKQFEFYSCNYMQYEIRKHWDKLKKAPGYLIYNYIFLIQKYYRTCIL